MWNWAPHFASSQAWEGSWGRNRKNAQSKRRWFPKEAASGLWRQNTGADLAVCHLEGIASHLGFLTVFLKQAISLFSKCRIWKICLLRARVGCSCFCFPAVADGIWKEVYGWLSKKTADQFKSGYFILMMRLIKSYLGTNKPFITGNRKS